MGKFHFKIRLLISLIIFLIISLFFYFFFTKKPSTLPFARASFFVLNHDPSFYYLEALIEDRKYLIFIDTGSFEALSLNKKVLQKIHNKKNNGRFNWANIHGKEFACSKFIVDLVKIGNILITDVTTTEWDDNFFKKDSLLNPNLPPSRAVLERSDYVSGSIGSGLLRKHSYWALDFPRSQFLFIKNFSEFLKKTELPLSSYLETPMDPTSSHLIISIETDFGIKRFLVDTGADLTLLDLKANNFEKNWIISKNFKIGEKNFGPTKIHALKLSKAINHFEGILGMDFLKNRNLLLDFEKNRIFIGPKEKQIARRPVDYIKISNVPKQKISLQS